MSVSIISGGLYAPDPKQVERVKRDTWGHLAPQRGYTYDGFAVVCRTPMREWNLLDYGFEGLGGNPWTYEHVGEWWSTLIDRLDRDGDEQQILIWRWQGKYRLQKNDRPFFSIGSIIPFRIVEAEKLPRAPRRGVAP